MCLFLKKIKLIFNLKKLSLISNFVYCLQFNVRFGPKSPLDER
jgi:hypothetical protein